MLARTSLILVSFLPGLAPAQVERPRLPQEKPPGTRVNLSLGTLYLPRALPPAGKVPLFLHFHGPGWIAEVAAARSSKLAVLHAQLGSGSAVYGKPFADPKRLRDLLAEAGKKSGRTFDLVGLTGWSAGYGAVRAILRVEEYQRQVRWVVLMDGLHAGYRRGEVGLPTREPLAADLDCFVRLARDAAAGRKRFLVTHTRIVPGRYASTTETAEYLRAQVGAKREKPARPGDTGLPVVTEVRKSGLRILGCTGDTAADHVDHLHVLPVLIRLASLESADKADR